MAVFRYRMQSILEIKRKLEDQAKENFAVAQRQFLDAEDELQRLYLRKSEYEALGARLRHNALNVREIIENKEAIELLGEFCAQQEKKVEIARKNAENARKIMLDARTETKTQEKLRESAFETFVNDENRKEMGEIDELTNYRFHRTDEEQS